MNPWTLVAGAALVSTPIIIHLINRMRFRRVKWAAMEFLLKAQKKMRRKKILEQLLLLLLRCLLVFLAGLLFARFLGLNPDEGKETRPVMHVVVLDNTPSMADTGAAAAGPGNDAFSLARAQITEKIVTAALKASTPQRLRVIRLSDQTDILNPGDKEPDLISAKLKDTLQGLLAQEKLTTKHVPLADGLRKAKQLLDRNPGTETSKIVHVVSDMRSIDWTAEGEAIASAVKDLDEAGAKVHLIDVATPYRKKDRKTQNFSENVGIVELKPRKRIAALGEAVEFDIRIKNYGITTHPAVMVQFTLNGTQNLIQSIQFEKLLPGEERSQGVRVSMARDDGATTATTENPLGRFNVVTAVLKVPGNDALPFDNIRYAAVEVREKLSVLVVMNRDEFEQSKSAEGPKKDGDSFYLRNLFDTKFSGVQWVSGTVEDLEKRDLREFSSIYLLNVPVQPEMKPTQVEQLERYIKDGGGVGVFLGHLAQPGKVDPADPKKSTGYNGLLYRNGQGFFPFPLPLAPTAPLTQEERDKRALTFTKRVLIRDPVAKSHPALAGIYQDDIVGTKDTADKVERLFFLAGIFQHWKIERIGRWLEDRTIQELYCLPNESSIADFQGKAEALAETIRGAYGAAKFSKFRDVVDDRLKKIRDLVSDSENPPLARLAQQMDRLLADQTSDADPTDALLREFWGHPEMGVAKSLAQSLRDSSKYGDPLYVARKFGAGRVAVFTIPAGAAPAPTSPAWTDWPYGPGSSGWVAVMTECQKYLSGGGSEDNRVLGSTLEVSFDPARYMPEAQWRLLTYDLLNPNAGAGKLEAIWEPKLEQAGKKHPLDAKDGLRLTFTDTNRAGVYLFTVPPKDTDLPAPGTPARKPEYVAAVFNPDTEREGDLRRATSDDFEVAAKKAEVHAGDEDWAEKLEQKPTDLSSGKWIFLLILLVLIFEQAMAVRLSYHRRPDDLEALAPSAAAAMAGRTAVQTGAEGEAAPTAGNGPAA
jgi:hypothetical protein